MNIKFDGMEFECTVDEAIALMKERSKQLQDQPILTYKFSVYSDNEQSNLVGRYTPDVTGDSVRHHG